VGVLLIKQQMKNVEDKMFANGKKHRSFPFGKEKEDEAKDVED
jgi:hypothetical protein